MPNFLRYTIIIVLAGLLFIPFLGHVHLFDWDEINFAECAREMIVSKDYLRVQIDFLPFWEKPPLFIWMQVLSMKMFGINEFAARFPNAIIGIATLCAIYFAGRRV
ncbi:MAG: glycosyltransferase family 39 protein, partial [Bacteroidetes bacterium]|nr:glycosyltransferase family 39 protein [Bacteroidota bacterium]